MYIYIELRNFVQVLTYYLLINPNLPEILKIFNIKLEDNWDKYI